MKFKRAPIVQPRLAIDVYEQILYAIVNGHFEPGERLIQEQIAEEINVSRTPVREALLRLEQEGVLVQTGRKGFSIRNISDDEVRSLYGAREAIEGYAAYRMAADRSPEKLAIIKAAVDAELTEGEQTLEEEFMANKDIHRLIVEQVGNPALMDMFDNIWNRGISLWLFAATRGDEASVQSEVHVDLYNVIAEGTPEEAHREMIRHIGAGLGLHLK